MTHFLSSTFAYSSFASLPRIALYLVAFLRVPSSSLTTLLRLLRSAWTSAKISRWIIARWASDGDITLTISLLLCYADVAYILFNICENQTICIMPYSRRVLISGDESEFMEPSNISFTSEQHRCQSKQSTPCFLFDDDCKIISDTIIYVVGHFLYVIISSACNCTILDAICNMILFTILNTEAFSL